MAKLTDVQTVLERMTGMHPNAIDRSVRKLVEGGSLPPADFAPHDAATLLVALAAARAPIEALEAVADYRQAPLVSAMTSTGGSEVALVIDADRQPVRDIGEWAAVRSGAIDAVALFIRKIPALRRAGRPHAVCLEIAMQPGAPIAALAFVHAPERALRLIYSDPRRSADLASWTTSRFVDSPVFDAVAALFDDTTIATAEAPAAISRGS